jgi:hypothetical protein
MQPEGGGDSPPEGIGFDGGELQAISSKDIKEINILNLYIA